MDCKEMQKNYDGLVELHFSKDQKMGLKIPLQAFKDDDTDMLIMKYFHPAVTMLRAMMTKE
jgi:hypothetical protein